MFNRELLLSNVKSYTYVLTVGRSPEGIGYNIGYVESRTGNLAPRKLNTHINTYTITQLVFHTFTHDITVEINNSDLSGSVSQEYKTAKIKLTYENYEPLYLNFYSASGISAMRYIADDVSESNSWYNLFNNSNVGTKLNLNIQFMLTS